MPIQPMYPGVYVEEVPSGVRTITGVSTAVTAFIGRALMGPVDEAVSITSFADFERRFGGLWMESTMSYAVQDFYQNGGTHAIIVRVANAAVATVFALKTTDTPKLLLAASSAGNWANKLKVRIATPLKDPVTNAALDTKYFNFTILQAADDGKTPILEEYLKVTLDKNDVRYLPRLLEQKGSRLMVQKSNWISTKFPLAAVSEAIPVVADGGALGTDGNVLTATQMEAGLKPLANVDLVNLLCIPPPERGTNTPPSCWSKAAAFCATHRAMLIVDPPIEWGDSLNTAVSDPKSKLNVLTINGPDARNAALYYPLINKPDSLRDGQLDTFVPCGAIAGVMAMTDATRGVWKSPAGLDAALRGITSLQVTLNDEQNGELNPLGINVLRTLPLAGQVIWGARTLRGADQLADEYKYVAVRRLALFVEESLFRGTKWVVFEPNDESLWAQIRLNVGAFMHTLFRQGAFQGKTPKEAYMVKCDKDTTTQTDINSGIVNVLIGFAPLKPAEFVMLKIQQMAGNIDF